MDDELHTFLFADISGYSTLTELEGDEAAAEVAIAFADCVSRMAAEHGAEVVRTIGDAVMVHCVNAAQTVELGMRLQAEFCSHNLERRRPTIHVGIHTGPAVGRAGDWWGATVNVAARVAAAAQAGQLLVTHATAHAAGEASAVGLRELGFLHLKNISAPVGVFAAWPAEHGSAAAGLLQVA